MSSSSDTTPFLESTAQSPNTLYILFPHSPVLSDTTKQELRQFLNSLNRKLKEDDSSQLLSLQFADELPLESLQPDDLDEPDYIWAIQNDDILGEYGIEKGFDQERKDIELWIMSQMMTLQHMGMFQGIEMGGEDDQDDDQDTLAKKIVTGQEIDDDDDDQDEEFVPEDEGEDDDDDLPDDEFDDSSAAAMMEQLEKLKSLHLEEDKDMITQNEVQELWVEYGKQLERNALAFTAFKDAMTKYVSELMFTRNPVMKMMNQFTDPAAADADDLEQLLDEVRTIRGRNPEVLAKYPASVEKHKSAIQEKYGEKWTDDCEYLVENLAGAEGEDEEELEDQEKSSQDEDSQYTLVDHEWMIAGPEIQRIQVGSFAVSRKWKGQFRCKVDPVNEQLIYYMFEFTPSTIPRANQNEKYHRDFFKTYMQQELDLFKESRLYKVVIPLDTLHRLQYHESEVEATLCLTVLQVNQPPLFFNKLVKNLNGVGQWDECADFSAEYQLSQFATHYLVGFAREWSATLGTLVMQSKEAADVYRSDTDYDPIEEEGEDANFELDAELMETEQGEVPFGGVAEGGEEDGEGGEGCVVM
uniref:Uncharacterized protein n=1 Tax=Percolomonas cosmopolitus TaxID=63605 RepID=A0A7S1KR19_9EUKA